MLGSEAAKLALEHGLKRDITRIHYREEVSDINWTGLALEEDLQTWSGYATQRWIPDRDEENVQRDPKVQELDKRVQDGLERLRTLTGEKFRSRQSSVVHHLDSDKANVQQLARLIQGARGEKGTLVRKHRRGLREEKKKIC
ncbi:unnamed protein product [Tilletia caries]|nr:unnamed protein product [Tilletia caries]